MADKVILKVEDLCKEFPIKKNWLGKALKTIKAVDHVSFELYEGETFGLVGESGCGKSTLGRTIMRLYDATSGTIDFKDTNIAKLSRKELRNLREEVQFIFQDPYSSLNPRMNVFEIISEPLKVHKYFDNDEDLKTYVLDLMEKCGLPSYYCYRYPHQFSGGQRQRIGIARSLALRPSLVICDEPVSALDVSIQSQIINMLEEMQLKQKMSYIFISHDLSVVKHISDRVGVMYLGSLVELAPTDELYDNAIHPYTRALLSAIPQADPSKRNEEVLIKGEIPSNIDIPQGCKFHPRCIHAEECCKLKKPEYKEIKEGHYVACHFAEKFANK